MALLWIDGFEGYGTSIGSAPSPSGVIARRYASVTYESIFDIESGRISGYALEFNGINRSMKSPALTTDATVVIGFGFKAYADTDLVRLFDGTTLGVNLAWESGELAVYRGSTLLGKTVTLGLLQNTWYYVELKVTCNSSTGSFTVHLGEVDVLNASGINTKAGSHDYHDCFHFRGDLIIDDLYFLDSSGAQNNDFLGNSRVVAIRPVSDLSVQWTPSTGSDNYAVVDEAICNDDADYIEDSVAGHKDLYDYEDLGFTPAQVFGVQVNTMCRETDATPFDLITVVKSGTTESDDSGQTIGSINYRTKYRIIELDPDTTVAWTESGVNGAQFGVKVG